MITAKDNALEAVYLLFSAPRPEGWQVLQFVEVDPVARTLTTAVRDPNGVQFNLITDNLPATTPVSAGVMFVNLFRSLLAERGIPLNW